MGIARSSVSADPASAVDDTALVEAMHGIKDDFEAYGWRRMQAALRQAGRVVNHKKIKRLMREPGMNPVQRRRFVATTDSDHDQPIFPIGRAGSRQFPVRTGSGSPISPTSRSPRASSMSR